MKRISLLILFMPTIILSQNTFPPTGNAGIGTTTNLPSKLVIDGVDGFIDGITLQQTAAFRHLITGYADGGNPLHSGLQFKVANSWAGGNVAVMTLRGNGCVGIGTQEPTATLAVAVPGISNDPSFMLARNSGTADQFKFAVRGSSGVSWLSIWDGTNGTVDNGLVIKGNTVGIGTTTPAATLAVAVPGTTNDPSFMLARNSGTADQFKFAVRGGSGASWLSIWDGINGNCDRGIILKGDAVGIGVGTNYSYNPLDAKLVVNGNVKASKIIVTQTGWSDYVFDESYKLRNLHNLESYIKENKHLPEVPSAKEVEKKGISVGDNQALLLKKIEELTLYIIQQQKQIDQQEKQIQRLINKIKL